MLKQEIMAEGLSARTVALAAGSLQSDKFADTMNTEFSVVELFAGVASARDTEAMFWNAFVCHFPDSAGGRFGEHWNNGSYSPYFQISVMGSTC
jgi:hypothetical protein